MRFLLSPEIVSLDLHCEMDVSVETWMFLNPKEHVCLANLSGPVTFKWSAALCIATRLLKMILLAPVLCNGAFSCCTAAKAMHSHHVDFDHQTKVSGCIAQCCYAALQRVTT